MGGQKSSDIIYGWSLNIFAALDYHNSTVISLLMGNFRFFFEHPSKKMHLSLFLSKHLKKLSLFLVRLFRLIYRVSHRKVWKVILLWYLRIYIWIFSNIRGPVCSWETPFFAYLTSFYWINVMCHLRFNFQNISDYFFSQYFDF